MGTNITKYPNGIPVDIDNVSIGHIRINETNELIRYLGVYIDSSNKYSMKYSTVMTHEMTAQFEEAETIMRKKFGKNLNRLNGKHSRYGFIIKKVFDYIVDGVAWNLDRLLTEPDNKEIIETRLSNVLRHFA